MLIVTTFLNSDGNSNRDSNNNNNINNNMENTYISIFIWHFLILMITIVTLRFYINLEKTHQILNNNYNYENISYLEYINTIIIMRWQ